VLFSKSGASDELRRLVPLARAKGARVVGVTSDELSALANDADTHVTLPLERELCPFDLAPVTSCAIQMLFGDTCAVAAMRARRAVRDTNDALPPPKENERADPAGARDAPRVADVMHALDETEMLKSAPTCGSEELLVDVLVRLSSGGYGCVLVADRKDRKDRKETLELVGVFTDGDLRRRLGAEKTMCMRRRMAELCSRRCRTISRDASAADAARAMAPENGAKVSFLPVTQDEHSKTLVGIVTLNALVKAGL
jgi:arabinose-5-phosphate isomerase